MQLFAKQLYFKSHIHRCRNKFWQIFIVDYFHSIQYIYIYIKYYIYVYTYAMDLTYHNIRDVVFTDNEIFIKLNIKFPEFIIMHVVSCAVIVIKYSLKMQVLL